MDTGRHFDDKMPDIFFEELEINKLEYNFDINGSVHGAMTSIMALPIPNILYVWGMLYSIALNFAFKYALR